MSPQTHGRDGSFWQTVRLVAWSFFGVRRRTDQEQDLRRVKPQHVIVAGLVGAALFVGLLLLLVNWVVDSGASH
ncbi:DUF2970 domain-containing protein [Ideonella oryzae]|uniref:DUF2970 domain-containing protein n=1 Tax=Ideonella oryzae TaxID=2937441 RepID=A0ABT1BL26_9BURK|nr:DUF2970 domain-containing protein [Ideonella oryzae]MCO5976823.1 DUF2970 domain-containing protein [Ideonella oryzae]